VKPIETMRFEQFLQQKADEEQLEEELNLCVEPSFHSNYSYCPIVDGPPVKPKIPSCIKKLSLSAL
jgi:hypothetical protein